MKKLWLIVLLLCIPTVASAEEPIEETIEKIIKWKKEEQGIAANAPLLQDPFLKHAGSTAGDWYTFALGRIGYTDDFDAYLATIEKNVENRYKQENLLDATKATEWHRISLAILAAGGDATMVQNINLIADGTYNRAKIAPLDLQGINGLIWGLITLDSMRYIVPENTETTRQQMIEGILAAQLPDGGFSFYHDTADADITAMALQALAPYANSFEAFTYTQQSTKKEVTKSVRTVIEEALDALSKLQLEQGHFGGWGEPNAESTAQVLVALSALQIDPLTDSRFIKNKQTILDALMTYQQADGGFIHSATYNAENPTSLPDESNSMASEQVLYALIAYKRYMEDYRALYDLRAEMGPETKVQIEQFEKQLLQADLTNKVQVQQLITAYAAIPVQEVMYIDGFESLQQAVANLQPSYKTPDFTEQMGQNEHGKGTLTPILQQDIALEVNPEAIKEFLAQKAFTTADYNTVLRYIRYVEEQPEQQLLVPLQKVQQQLEKLQVEINALNEEILQNLYPISSITLADRALVEDVYARFKKLAPNDQQQIVNYEDLQQVNALIDSLQRELWIKRLLITVSIILIMLLGWRIWRKRRGTHI